VQALEKLGSKRGVPLLVAALADKASEVRSAAAGSVAALKAKEAVKPLAGLLKDQSLYVRHAAARALFLLEDHSGVAVLFADLRSPDLNTRIDAHRVAKEILGQDFGYAWDLPDKDRAAIVDKWEAWWTQTEREREPRR